MIQELTPLHQHVGENLIRSRLGRRDDPGRNQSGAGLGESLVVGVAAPADGQVESVFVDGFEDPPESRVGRAPERLLEIVASAVERSVLGMEAHVVAIRLPAVSQTAGSVGYEFQLLRTQRILIGEFPCQEIME